MSNNSLDKPFKTFQEQLDILNKRMTTDTNTIYYLMRNNYYSIVNFYKKPFIVNRRKEIYRHGTHFNDVKNLVVNNFNNLYFHEYNKPLITDHHFLRTFLKTCTEFRNAAGHNERFYNYKIRDSLNIKNTIGISSDKSDLFSIYEGLKFFLLKKEYEKLTENLKMLISNLEKDLNTDWKTNEKKNNPLPINDILKLICFPYDWHK